MNLDLDKLLEEWGDSDEGDARIVVGQDGEEILQLRVDLGLLQMSIDGRPDGQLYRGMQSVYEFAEHERQIDSEPQEEDWRELHRELQQYNYRRLALSGLIETRLHDDDLEAARMLLWRALRDIDRCREILDMLDQAGELEDANMAILAPTLVFNRARLMTRMHACEGRYEEAIEQAELGVRELETVLSDAGFDVADDDAENPAVNYLRQLADRLRDQYGIRMTLRERLEEAIEQENFEAAAQLRDELQRRQKDSFTPQLPSPE